MSSGTGRTGFAYAGTLDPNAVDEVLAEARDNVAFGTVDEWAGLAEPDGVARTPQPLWDDALAAFPTERKIELAKELERLTLAADRPRPRRRRQLRRRVGRGRRGHDDRDPRERPGERLLRQRQQPRRRRRRDADRASASASAASPTAFDLDKAASDAADRATRLLGATKPPSKRLTVVLDPFVTAQFLGVISSTLNGESVVKGRSLFRDRLGEQVAADIVTLVDDPTNPDAYTATDVDGEGLAARRNVLIDGGTLAAVRPLQLLGPARRHGVDRQRHPRRVRRHARRRAASRCSCSRAHARRPS